MKIYINDNTDPDFNLASEEYLLEHSDDDIFMLWRNSPAVIIGRNQNAFAEINFSFTGEHGIKVVRRLTGGGAVFHDLGNVNFTFISPAGGELSRGIRAGGLDFGYFTLPIVEALAGLGVTASLSGRNDIVADCGGESRKVSGNAQCVFPASDGKVKTMHHGTLLYSADMTSMQGALNVDPEKLKSKGVRSVRSRVANISDLIPADRRPDVEGFLDYLTDFAAKRFGTAAERFDDETVSGIRELARSKYSTDEWNIGKMGNFGLNRKKRFDFGTVGLGLDVREGRIARIRLDGDYFGVRDISELERALVGAFCSREEIRRRLIGAGVGGYIAGADTPEDAAALAEFICP